MDADLDEALRLLVRAIVFALCWGLLHIFLRPLARRTGIEPAQQENWVNRVIASLHALLVSIPCAVAMVADPHFGKMTSSLLRWQSAVDTVHGESVTLQTFLPISLGYFLYDSVILATDEEAYGLTIALHHGISLAIWPVSFLSKRGVYYLLYFMATELSTPLVHLAVFFLPQHGMAGGVLFLVIGISLLVVFFCVRILPAPWLYFSMGATWGYWQASDYAIQTIWLLTIPLPPMLNSFWFFKLVNGAVKKLAPAKPKGGKKE